MNSADELYADARNLSSLLLVEGKGDWANKITEAIEAGSTGSEIMMALRWNLKNLLKESELSEAVRLKSTKLHFDLNKALET